MRGSSDWRNSLSEAQKQGRGRVNLPVLARALEKLGTGGQVGVQHFANGFPAVGNMGEPGVHPVDKSRKQPGLEPEQVFVNAGSRNGARMSGARDPDAVQLRGEVMGQ